MAIIAVVAIVLLTGNKKTDGSDNKGSSSNGSNNSANGSGNDSNSGSGNSANSGSGNSSNNGSGNGLFHVENFNKETMVYFFDSAFYNANGEAYIHSVDTYDRSGDLTKYVYDALSDDTLYYITADLEPIVIAEKVDHYAISYSGDYIAYVQLPVNLKQESYIYIMSQMEKPLILIQM